MEYNEYIQNMTLSNPKIDVGDNVVVLVEYSLFHGTVLKVNNKSIKVHIPAQKSFIEHTKNCKPEKVLKYGTPAVIVWETWKGVNGRGGYRLETQMYSDYLKPVEQIQSSFYLNEEKFCTLKKIINF